MKEAKDFLIASGGEIPDPDMVVAYAKSYFNSNFQGWQEQNYPIWGLWRNWNTFAPRHSKHLKKRCAIHEVEDYDTGFCPKCVEPVKEEL